jgi:hypothetical protein
MGIRQELEELGARQLGAALVLNAPGDDGQAAGGQEIYFRLSERTATDHQNRLGLLGFLIRLFAVAAADPAIENVVDVVVQMADQASLKGPDLGDDAMIAEVMFRPLRQR